MGVLNDLWNTVTSPEALGAGAAALARAEGKGDLSSLRGEVGTMAGQARQDLAGQTSFKPFAVTSGAGTAGYDPTTGGMNLQSNQLGLTQAMQNRAGQLGQGLGQMQADPRMLAGMGMYGSEQALGQSMMLDPSLAGQRAAMGGLFGSQLGQVGMAERDLQGFSRQAMAGASQGLMGQQAPADIEALRAQYAGLAGQAAGNLGGTSEQSIYDRMQAMQQPEFERQQTALDNKLAAQGRLGVSTAQYGGTPEQLAMAKAQEEARASNSLQAMQMADQLSSSEQNRALQLGQQAGNFATTSSGLQSADLGRTAQLAGLGMQGTTTGQGLTAQQIGMLSGLQGQDIQSAQAQQALQANDLARAQGLFGLSSGAQGLGGQLEQQQIQNLSSLLGGSYVPEQQLLNTLSPAIQAAQLQQQGNTTGANLAANLYGQELGLFTDLGLAEGGLDQEFIRALSGIISSQQAQG